LTIGNVGKNIRAERPNADIYVYDNNLTDRTVTVAGNVGAICRGEKIKGKGNVVRRMFADIEADIYVMVDGNNTYDVTSVKQLIRPTLCEQADMVNAGRQARRRRICAGHRLGKHGGAF